MSPSKICIVLAYIISGTLHHSDGRRDNEFPFGTGNCTLPSHWIGNWITTDPLGLEEPSTEVVIDNNSISIYGKCVYLQNTHGQYKIALKTREDGEYCYRFLVINERHNNVLGYYRSLYCQDHLELTDFDYISNDPFHYLYRMDSQPIACPFRDGPYEFTYNNGGPECQHPISTLTDCIIDSKVVLRFQSCPNVNTESKEKIFTCIGTWKDYDEEYIVGKMMNRKYKEQNYRCLKISSDLTENRFKVSFSGTSTCVGLNADQGGHQVLTVRKESKSVPRCELPSWLINKSYWNSLDKSVQMLVKNGTSVLIFESQDESSGNAKYQFRCESVEESTADSSYLIGMKVSDCDHTPTCLRIYRRSDSVVDVQELEYYGEEKCRDMKESYITFVKSYILIKFSEPGLNSPANNEYKACPFVGKYSVKRITQNGTLIWKCDEGAFNTLIIGCPDSEKSQCDPDRYNSTLRFLSSCANASQPITKLNCLESWKSEDLTYIIAQDNTNESILQNDNNQVHFQQANVIPVVQPLCIVVRNRTDGSLDISTSLDDCSKSLSSEASLYFNADFINEIGESLESSSSAKRFIGAAIKVTTAILISVFTWA